MPYGTEATLQAKAYNAAGVELPVPEDGGPGPSGRRSFVELTYVGNTATVRTNMPSQVPSRSTRQWATQNGDDDLRAGGTERTL